MYIRAVWRRLLLQVNCVFNKIFLIYAFAAYLYKYFIYYARVSYIEFTYLIFFCYLSLANKDLCSVCVYKISDHTTRYSNSTVTCKYRCSQGLRYQVITPAGTCSSYGQTTRVAIQFTEPSIQLIVDSDDDFSDQSYSWNICEYLEQVRSVVVLNICVLFVKRRVAKLAVHHVVCTPRKLNVFRQFLLDCGRC